MIDEARPIYTLTVAEFRELLQQSGIEAQHGGSDTQQQITAEPRRLVYGIGGLARLLGCSTASAWRVKQSGKIAAAIMQEGRKIIIDADKALELLSNNKNATT